MLALRFRFPASAALARSALPVGWRSLGASAPPPLPHAWAHASTLLSSGFGIRAYAAATAKARDRRPAKPASEAAAAAKAKPAKSKALKKPKKEAEKPPQPKAEGPSAAGESAELRKWGIDPVSVALLEGEDAELDEASDDVIERGNLKRGAKDAAGAAGGSGAKVAGKRGTRWYQREIERLCSKEGDGAAAAAEEALRHHEKMAKEHVPMNLAIYNALIDAMASNGRGERAESLYADMRRRGIRPDTRTIVGVVNTCAEAIRRARLSQQESDRARIDKLLARVDELIKKDAARWEVKPNRILYNAAIKAAGLARRPEAAESWLEEMRARGVRPDEYTISSLLLAVDGQGQEALEKYAFRWVAELRSKDGVKPDAAAYNSLLQACRVAKDEESLMAVYNEMRHEGGPTARPDAATYAILMAALSDPGKGPRMAPEPERRAKQSAADKAKGYMQQARDLRVRLDTPVYNAFLGVMAWAGDAEGAREGLQRLRTDRLTPDSLSYVEVLRAHTRSGDYEGAWRWWEALRAQERGRPSLFAATAALHSLVRAAEAEALPRVILTERALAVCADMRAGKQRVRPDALARDLLSRLAQKTGSPELRAAALDERPAPGEAPAPPAAAGDRSRKSADEEATAPAPSAEKKEKKEKKKEGKSLSPRKTRPPSPAKARAR
eukprot:tig00020553_g10690.t1